MCELYKTHTYIIPYLYCSAIDNKNPNINKNN